MLAQLPDYAAGVRAVAAGSFAEALPPLQRATDVATAYFPEAAARERALCRATLGRCLWHLGRFGEAAAQLDGAHGSGGSTPASEKLALFAARAHFEAGGFDEAASLAAKAGDDGILVAEAIRIVQGETLPALTGEVSDETNAVRRLNGCVGRYVTDSGPLDTIGEEFGVGDLGSYLAPPEAGNVPADKDPSLTLVALRSTAGQLAVACGAAKQPWTRPLLVSALKGLQAIEPISDPTLQPFFFRSLAALATLTDSQLDAITAEGLFTSAMDSVNQTLNGPCSAAFRSGRGKLWCSQVFAAFADILENGRRAEDRKTEIAGLREKAGPPLTQQQLRWALLYLPPLGKIDEELFIPK